MPFRRRSTDYSPAAAPAPATRKRSAAVPGTAKYVEGKHDEEHPHQYHKQHHHPHQHHRGVSPMQRLSRTFVGLFKSKDDRPASQKNNTKQDVHVVKDERRTGYSLFTRTLSSPAMPHNSSTASASSSSSPPSSPTLQCIPINHHILTHVIDDATDAIIYQTEQEQQKQKQIDTLPKNSGLTTRSPITQTNSNSNTRRSNSTSRQNSLRLCAKLVSHGSIRDKYELETRRGFSGSSLLGRGKHSTVRLASVRACGTLVAVKKYRLYQLSNSDIRSIRSEVEILSKIRNMSTHSETPATEEKEGEEEAVVRMLDCYVDDEEACVFLVLELLRGGELFDLVVDRTCLREEQAKEAIKGVARALQLCHSRGIAHRDIKPENVLLVEPIASSSSSSSSSRITTNPIMPASNFRLVDFGFAKDISGAVRASDGVISGQVCGDDLMRTACGTPSYTAPEVLLSSPHRSVFATRAMQQHAMLEYEGYGLKADIWSLGVVAYVCLCGYLPFGEEEGSTSELFRQIVEAKVSFHSQYWRNVSNEAKDLVRKLLCPDPSQRLSAEQVLAHPWLRSTNTFVAGTENTTIKR